MPPSDSTASSRVPPHVLPALGATCESEGVRFAAWAPNASEVTLRLEGDDARSVALARGDDAIHRGFVRGLVAGARYRYALDGGPPFPDPVSRAQPDGVHGASEVVDPTRYPWRHDARGVPEPPVIYELHVGTFTPEGTFDAVRRALPYLAELGVTALELMPLHAFPGTRGWGYDPAALFAPHPSYGPPEALRRLVDEAHGHGLSVLLDVVYNHLGPDGAYWAAFGPVLTDRHSTPWGVAIDLDGPRSRGVRDTILLNALRWLTEYRFDGLRLDATFALIDGSSEHLLSELSRRVEALEGPPRWLVAEDDRNEVRLLRPRSEGGHGLGGVWADDLHHLVRRRLAGDRHGYFAAFPTSTAAIAECLEHNWYRRGRPDDDRGSDARGVDAWRFVTCIQNHDQIGNRPMGDRLHDAVPLAQVRAATATLLFAPQTPLLFQGQEWAASAPFQYFTDHAPELGQKVSEGRRREFGDFPGFAGEVPDPQAEATFRASVLEHTEKDRAPHRETLALHRALLAARRELAGPIEAHAPAEGLLYARRGAHALAACLLGEGRVPVPAGAAAWIDTEDAAFGGATPARLEDGAVGFEGPGAVWLRLPEGA